jgi:cell division protease FtsH
MVMDCFDRIIGYESIKNELKRTADVLRNPEVYQKLGVQPPCGLLLYGVPGVGKTLMAKCLIEASGRTAFPLRRNQPDGDFVRAIDETFSKAAESEPSIVFLDDMDKFATVEEDRSNEEEFVAVQACIDNLKGKSVFVLATANSLGELPDCLLRPGSFDMVVEISEPNSEDNEKIIEYYLSQKPHVDDVDPKQIARIMIGRSCAELETALNSAGLLAGFDRSDKITMRHILMGCISITHHVTRDFIISNRTDHPDDVNSTTVRVACHEAGHLVVAETLSPGSVTIACIHNPINGSRGFVSYYDDDCGEKFLDYAMRSLGGYIAVQQRFGIVDTGAGEDIEKAKRTLHNAIEHHGLRGMAFLESPFKDSDNLLSAQESALFAELERCCTDVRQILSEHKAFLDATIKALLEKGLLTADDITNLKKQAG